MRKNIVIFAVALAVAVAAGASRTLAQQASSPVADAARKGDQAAVVALLKKGADVNAPHADGMTPLHWAAERGEAAMADALLRAGAQVGTVTRLGNYTPLHLAARAGSAEVTRALVKARADVGALSATGSTPLHLAAGSGSAPTVMALLDAGADINVKDAEFGQTPLVFAVAQGHLATVEALVKRGADVNLATKVIDIQREQALTRQSQTIRRQVLNAIVPSGAQPTASQQQAAIQAAREFYATGKTPPAPQPAAGAAGAAGGRGGGGRGGGGGGGGAATAAAAGPDAPAPGGGTGREGRGGAAGGGQQNADANAEGPAVSGNTKGGMTPLHHAARIGFTAAVPVLLEAGADINEKASDGNSPLHVALINGQFDLAMMLVEKGANVNMAADTYGVPPLWAAVNTRWQPRTRFPQPQEMDYQKATYLDVMEALLRGGADPNARVKGHPWYMVYSDCGNANCGLSNVTGSTAFWRAAYGLDVEAMKLLVKYGADPYIPTMAGGGGGRGGGGGGRGGGAGAAGGGDPSGLPPNIPGGPGVYPLHAAAGAEYGEGFAGNAHRYAPDSWMPAVKYLVEEIGMDVNMRDDGGYTPLHHAAARGDNEMILYLVSKGADVKAISRRNQTTADMANGPVSRISPYPATIELLVKLGAKNNNRCASCAP